jgi:hypothetical protein
VYFHGKKQEHLFAPLRLCVSARDILVAAIRIRGILRLSSDSMPERIECRQVSENSRIFPPLKKGGQGGFPMKKEGQGGLLFSTFPGPLHHYPINLLHHRFLFYHYLPAAKIPPAPFAKGGDIWGMFSAFLLSYCHKKQENLFAPLRLCVSARDILVAAIRIGHWSLSDMETRPTDIFRSRRTGYQSRRDGRVSRYFPFP